MSTPDHQRITMPMADFRKFIAMHNLPMRITQSLTPKQHLARLLTYMQKLTKADAALLLHKNVVTAQVAASEDRLDIKFQYQCIIDPITVSSFSVPRPSYTFEDICEKYRISGSLVRHLGGIIDTVNH